MNGGTKSASSFFSFLLNLKPQPMEDMIHMQDTSSFFSWMFLKNALTGMPKGMSHM